MLTLKNVEVMYLNVIMVLRGISLTVPDQGIIVLMGANGTGKTTALKAISGLLRTEEGNVSEGTIEFDGLEIQNGDPAKISEMGIIQVMEGRRLFEHLTIEENLMVGACMRKDRGNLRNDLEAVFNYFPPLRKIRSKIAGYASGGEQQMAAVGRALMANPKTVLLDEPSLGLSPIITNQIYDIIKRMNKEENLSILLVEQNARLALEASDYGYVMEAGRIVLDGPAERLRENEDVKEFYLGLSEIGQRKSYHDVKHYRRRKRWL